MNTITLTIDEALLLEAYKAGRHRSHTDTIIAALQMYINNLKAESHLNGTNNPIADVDGDDKEDSGTIYDLHKHAVDFDIGVDDLSVKIGHPSHEIPKQDKPVVDANIDDGDDSGTIYDLHKHAVDFDIGANDLSVNLDHYLYGLPKRDE